MRDGGGRNRSKAKTRGSRGSERDAPGWKLKEGKRKGRRLKKRNVKLTNRIISAQQWSGL